MLVVCPDMPYPPVHGGRLDMYGRIRALKQLGFTVDVVATVKGDVPTWHLGELRAYVDQLLVCRRQNRFVDLLAPTPLQLESRRCLKNVCLKHEYDVVILESEYVYRILENPQLKARHVVLRVHNDEASYFLQLAKSAFPRLTAVYYYTEAVKFKLMEAKLVSRMHNRMFISYEELKRFQSRYRSSNSIFLPPAIDVSPGSFRTRPLNSRTVLFIGSLFMPNNREGITWFVTHVHPRLQDLEGYNLVIAGNTKGKNLNWLRKLGDAYTRITICENPKELEQLYANSSVFINPVLHGAGVKMKVIDAIRNGLPVVSTKVGIEGTGLVHGRDVLIGDTPIDFARHVRALLCNLTLRRELVSNAQKFLYNNYNQVEVLGKYLEPMLKES